MDLGPQVVHGPQQIHLDIKPNFGSGIKADDPIY
jgi:hypothetical protein